MTTQDFINKSNIEHTSSYNYDKAHFVNNYSKVIITCPTHGDFMQSPHNHLQGQGCPKCKTQKAALTRNIKARETFFCKVFAVHGAKYGYTKSQYTKANKKIIITCYKHGDFKQAASNHLRGQGCQKCGNEALAQKMSGKKRQYQDASKPSTRYVDDADCIRRMEKVHGNRYDYSLVHYHNVKQKIVIICRVHGEFKQLAGSHSQGHGCRQCSIVERADNRNRIASESFVTKANVIHKLTYSYGNVKYKDSIKKVIITCPTHGDFMQSPHIHLSGRGCLKCKRPKMQSAA